MRVICLTLLSLIAYVVAQDLSTVVIGKSVMQLIAGNNPQALNGVVSRGFAIVDINKDNVITQDEINASVSYIAINTGINLGTVNISWFDANNDGRITLDEAQVTINKVAMLRVVQ